MPIPIKRVAPAAWLQGSPADRFRRSLNEAPTGAAVSPRAAMQAKPATPARAETERALKTPVQAEPEADIEAIDRMQAEEEAPEVPETAVPQAAALQVQAVWPEFIARQADNAPPDAWQAAVPDIPAEDPFSEKMAAMILALVRTQDDDVSAWSVTLPLHPDPMPETEVTLSLSPHWLSVRFSTQSSASLQRLWKEFEKLRTVLKSCFGQDRDIDIEIR